jgi:hypothetical protein
MADEGQSELRNVGRQAAKHLVDGLDATMERMRGNPLRLVCWFLLLVWFGITLLLYELDKVETVQKGWAVFAWGGGAIAFIETLLRLIVPSWREPVVNPVVWGIIWIAVGFSLWYDSWETLGPIGIIGLGLVAIGWVVLWQARGLSKSLDERVKKVRESPARFVTVSVLIIWFGVSLLLNALDTISDPQRGWAVFALGGAVLFFLETLVRLIVPRWRQPVIYSFMYGVVWLAVGLSLWYSNLAYLAPAVVIGLGVTLLGLLLPKPSK